MNPDSIIIWAIVAAILAGALLHLLKRPNLYWEQKLVALLVALAVSVPVGGLLMVPLFLLVWNLWWDYGISGVATGVVFFVPPTVVVGIGIIIAGNVADRREARKATPGTDGPSD